MWRGGGRLGRSVAAPFVWRCPSNLAIAPFPHPAHRTGRADLPHPALGQDITLAHATPSAGPEHFAKFDRLPNLRVLTASCVGPELRPLSSTGVTRLPRCRVGGGARGVTRALASARRPNCSCGFPASSFHKDAVRRWAREGIRRTRFTSPSSP